MLDEGRTYWELRADLLLEAGRRWSAAEAQAPPLAGACDLAASDAMARWMLGNADRSGGGFGAAPKFVLPDLMKYAALRAARGDDSLLEHARGTLEKLVAGPLFDGKDGGVHRMAAAPMWAGIQYEKMLAGNTALISDLVLALRQEDSASLRSALERTARFVIEVLGRPGGGFYLAQAADLRSADGGAYWAPDTAEDLGPPPVDRLVLAGPNSLAGAALVRAGLLLDDPKMVRAGRGALDLVLERGYLKGRGVRHVIEPNPDDRVFLTAQADTALGLLDAYETLR